MLGGGVSERRCGGGEGLGRWEEGGAGCVTVVGAVGVGTGGGGERGGRRFDPGGGRRWACQRGVRLRAELSGRGGERGGGGTTVWGLEWGGRATVRGGRRMGEGRGGWREWGGAVWGGRGGC